MLKICRIAIAVSLSLSAMNIFAVENLDKVESLPILAPESQHAASSKRVTAQFTRAHYSKVDMDDALSEKIFDRYIKQLDYARNVFLATDIEDFQKHRLEFDQIIARGKLDIAYDIFNLNLQRRAERYEYALSLLEKEPFDFTVNEVYNFDREEADWPKDSAELNELWRLKVKYDALNLTLAGKEWPKVQEVLGKRYRYAIKRLKQSESEDVFQVVMNSFARVVEPHTSYLSPRNAEKFQMDMNLSLEGIGAVLRAEEDYTVINSVVPGGPADKSNEVKPKDRIVGVAQDDDKFEDVIGWRLDDVVDLIKGPKGTKVRLQILPAEAEDDAVIKVVTIVRDKIVLEDRAAKSEVYFETKGDEKSKKLGIITIPSFYNNLSRDVNKELDKLKAEQVAGIIIDLRGNGGGSLREATLLTGLFIDKGPVVQIRDGANRVQVNSDDDGVSSYDGSLTVMVDRYSASASEIFAAAIQDYGRGVIVGEHTFGKGTVQQHRGLGRVYDLYDNPLGSIQFTIAKFYRINGGSTQHRGVLPDISFPTAVDPEDWGESREKNALPWDQIPKAKYQALGNLSADLTYLTSLHSERVKGNREFNYLLDDIAVYQKEKDDKTISLKLDERKAKREERKAKQLIRVNERLVVMGKEKVKSLEDLPDELEELDPFLDETAKITFDLISLGKVAKK
ncbi:MULTISPECIES: carboxy terminal-processing peptidase [unclassified Colwellia]|uniref:carboxy terminal-processing peptidase n=1 Tax=unclassified Colwellia TaxID=196834 RepID=UPI0015F67D83|nr:MULTISPECIES: carboxy terminal-processing peptidase [unclassified Colwellia]MBA6349022.1 carboxy terminal-processing peptidase [Colwellia sp. BRX8-9]MBA6351983.1 carboxy terminal-processing peptidase [Colwellia sp. BRX9-1]MBA6354997.1 carboxy terminal-processing peptidase [Colwellia sp. BRX8-3]MBA6359884.1 carboxy terminal-processing peptidase [Colwellia sp. BRX8-6]MBA6366899.1 carboxy terminal-processing peptidase [Colwellia sp. BRX8-5]